MIGVSQNGLIQMTQTKQLPLSSSASIYSNESFLETYASVSINEFSKLNESFIGCSDPKDIILYCKNGCGLGQRNRCIGFISFTDRLVVRLVEFPVLKGWDTPCRN